MTFRPFSVLGIFVSLICLWAATTLFPSGFNWSRDYVSTLLRGPVGPARTLAEAGVILFCVSIAAVFARLSRVDEFSKCSQVIRIGGIGSMVYSALTITPMHDLMVTISVGFLLLAVLPITWTLYVRRETAFFVAGCVCLAVFSVSAISYYGNLFPLLLPWAQRVSYVLFAGWLVSLDYALPRER